MRNLFLLVKVQFLSFFGINKMVNSKTKGKVAGSVGLVIVFLLFGALVGFVGYVYAEIFASMMASSPEHFLPMMFAIISLACLAFSFFTASSLLYGFKDYDLLSALPIKSSTIIISKLVLMYLADFCLAVLLLIPSVIIYSNVFSAIEIERVVRLFVMAFTLPAFPMFISILLGSVITIISSRFKKRNLIQTLGYMIVIVLVASMSMDIDLTGGENVLSKISKIYFIYNLVLDGFGSWLGTLIFMGVSLGALAIIIIFASLTFVKMNSLIKAKITSKTFRLKTYQAKGVRSALLKKEFKLFFSSAIYVMNTVIGPIMLVIFSVVFLILSSQVPGFGAVIPMIAPVGFVFCCFMAPTTSCAISIEGSSFWIVKTSPISFKQIVSTKKAVNSIITGIPSLISVILLTISMWGYVDTQYYFTCFAFAVLCVLLSGNIGMTFNLLFPVLKWENVNKAVKQGTSVLLSVISALILSAIVVVVMFVWEHQDLLLKHILLLLFLAVITVLTQVFITLKGEKLLLYKTRV